MPRPIELDGLPETVYFTNWHLYQSDRTQAFARLWTGVLFDGKVVPPGYELECARGVLCTGIAMAAQGRGKVSTTSWLLQLSRRRRAILFLKSWLFNGLLSVECPEGRGVTKGEGRAKSARAAPPPKLSDTPALETPALPKPAKRRKPPNGEAGITAPTGNWIGPVLEEWREKHGSLPDDQVRGKLMRGLQSVYASGQTPAQMGERFGIWLAIKPAEKHRYVEDFTSRYGDYDPERCRSSEYLLSLMPALA